MLTEMAETTRVLPVLEIARPSHAAPVDPVLAVVEGYRLARTEYDEAGDALASLEAKLPADVAHCPRVVLGKIAGSDGKFKEKSAFSHRQIDQWFDRTIESERKIWGEQFDDEQMKKLMAEAHRALDADMAAVAKAQEETGFAAATERYRKADAAEFAALEAVCATTPETIAGAHALLSMLLLDDMFDGSPDLRELQLQGMRLVERALRDLAL